MSSFFPQLLSFVPGSRIAFSLPSLTIPQSSLITVTFDKYSSYCGCRLSLSLSDFSLWGKMNRMSLCPSQWTAANMLQSRSCDVNFDHLVNEAH